MALDGTELCEAITAVREGLTAAQQGGDGSPIRFTVKEITLDLGIELRRTTAAGGGVKAFVVSADGRSEHVNATTHRMTVTLEVEPDSSGRDLLIGDTDRGLDPLPAPAVGS